MFSENGQAEDGTPIGPSLLCVAATSTPFLSGTPIQFAATPGAHAMAQQDYATCGVCRRYMPIPAGATVWPEHSKTGRTPMLPDEKCSGSGKPIDHTMSASPAAATTMAEGWSSALKCPACGKQGTLKSNDAGAYCTACGWSGDEAAVKSKNPGASLPKFSAAPTRAGKGATTMASDSKGAPVGVGDRVRGRYTGDPAGQIREGTVKGERGRDLIVEWDGGWVASIYADGVTKMSTSAPSRRFNQGAPMDPEKIAAMAGFAPEDDDAAKLAKCMAYMTKMGELEIKHGDEEPEEVKAMAEDLGVEPGPKVMSRMRAALKATRVPVTTMAAMQGEIKSLADKLAARDQADADAKINTFADDAIKAGRWDSAKRAELIAFARADMKAAASSLLPEGAYTALSRISAGVDSRGNASGSAPDASGAQRFGVKLSDAAKKFARDNKVSFEKALVEVAKDPALASDYLPR